MIIYSSTVGPTRIPLLLLPTAGASEMQTKIHRDWGVCFFWVFHFFEQSRINEKDLLNYVCVCLMFFFGRFVCAFK